MHVAHYRCQPSVLSWFFILWADVPLPVNITVSWQLPNCDFEILRMLGTRPSSRGSNQSWEQRQLQVK